MRDWLKAQYGFAPRGIGGQLASIVGSHHGVTPDDSALSLVGSRPDLAGDGDWATTREAVLARATERCGGAAVFARFATTRLSVASQVLLTGIVILADWIASNQELFPLLVAPSPDAPIIRPDDAVTAQRVERGWRQLQLPARWRAVALDSDLDAEFQFRFDRAGARARPVQAAAVAVARAQRTPGLVIVEAPMGSGKTEAGLLAAEELAARSGASGVFVALPTQATTDAMFGRVLAWLDRLPREGAVTLNLVHGKAHLNDEFRGLVPEWKAAGIGQDDDPSCQAAIAHSWLRGRKKSALASFVVGTIDQVLFCGLKSRHLMLRHLAMAGKVVIIDEVHAYDVYMSQYLDRVLQWLGAYGVPVVLLSATLPDRRRAELLRAYDPETPVTDEHPGYPLISSSGCVAPMILALQEEANPVTVDRLPDDADTLVAYLRTHLADGGCAAVVRNTVTRVQETANRLIEEFGSDAVTVTHSRFLACERASLDRSLLTRFGPDGSRRPRLHIVVASQVIEQSLDVDFDLMISDLAPVDLVLQRLGRLHRHQRTRPGPVRVARCALVGVEDWSADPVTTPSAARRIYGEHQLLRAAALLRDRDTIGLPHDIAPLVQTAYGAGRLGPDSWQPTMATAAATAERLAVERTAKAGDYLVGPPGKAGSLGPVSKW
ncbi:CRISPR-associated endonuclease/helicase Cas3 [Labedaea rhizosphaerae]|uniref:CRISPR-associated endonuclease/helicase Cas3 n=1 Tax=Labedaea rhizosphaerae TaxID=598644 RepID=A0A4R6SGP3_LABRH|nr:CRISPR-associated endonuclease/helicase Cas3 [Labedaea rhizosphaerae]